MKKILITFMLLSPFLLKGQVNNLIDSSFNKIGFKLLDLGDQDDAAHKCYLSSKNKIYVTGRSGNSFTESGFIARLNVNGQIDSSFNSKGNVINQAFSYIYDSYEDASNKIIIAGINSLSRKNMIIARYLENGTIDKTFNVDGIQEIDYNNQEEWAQKINEDSKGRYLVAGKTGDGFYSDVLISRLNNVGDLDNSFNQTGKLVLSFGPKCINSVADFLITYNDKILLVINQYTESSSQYNINCFLINENGTIDSTFGDNGKLIININLTDLACSIIKSDDAFYIGGYTTKSNKNQIILAKMDSLGRLDSTFGNKGIAINPIGSFTVTPTSMAITTDKSFRFAGRIATTGVQDACIVGISNKGIIDTSFSINGVYQFDRSKKTDQFNSLFIYPSGQIITAGYSEDSIDEKTIVLRLKNSINVGTIDRQKTISITKFFPNPLQRYATIEFDLTEALELGISLFDETGKYLYELASNKPFPSGAIEIPIEFPAQMSSGNYVLVVHSKNKVLASIKTNYFN